MDSGALVSDDHHRAGQGAAAGADCSRLSVRRISRTIPQADAMKDAAVRIDFVLEIDVPDDAIVERMAAACIRARAAATTSSSIRRKSPDAMT
jgi:adenylate kinase